MNFQLVIKYDKWMGRKVLGDKIWTRMSNHTHGIVIPSLMISFKKYEVITKAESKNDFGKWTSCGIKY